LIINKKYILQYNKSTIKLYLKKYQTSSFPGFEIEVAVPLTGDVTILTAGNVATPFVEEDATNFAGEDATSLIDGEVGVFTDKGNEFSDAEEAEECSMFTKGDTVDFCEK
jgi:hypothetical protein